MSTSINSTGRSLQIQLDNSRTRQTTNTSFPTIMKKTAGVIAQAGASLGPSVPVATVLTAAANGLKSSGSGLTSAGANALTLPGGGGSNSSALSTATGGADSVVGGSAGATGGSPQAGSADDMRHIW